VRLSHWLGEEPTSSPAWSLLATRKHSDISRPSTQYRGSAHGGLPEVRHICSCRMSDPSERLGARHEQSPKTSDLQRGIPRRLSGAFFALSWYVQLLNSHEQVRKTLMKSRLSPPGQRPIVCIDEAQVRVFLLSSSII